MLNVFGRQHQFCDQVNRRAFLKIGGFSLGAASGLGLADILRAQGGEKASQHKAVINIFLGGGPPHQDMWDIKVDAPREIRGEFSPIDTKVPGIQIGECFPLIAGMMDKFVAIRSVVGCVDNHDGYQCLSGWARNKDVSIGGRPCIGAVASRIQGPVNPSMPPSVALAAITQHVPWSEPGAPGFLGTAYQPFKPDGQGMADLTLNGVSLDRLQDRKSLLGGLDQLKREVDVTGMLRGMDSFTQAAFGVLTSSKLAEALDLSKEDPKLRARYGDGKPYQFQYDGAPTVNGGKLDQAVTALVSDLEERGMLNDVTVVVWGEFGRTPRVNPGAGRDHWPQVSCALLAGGGMRTGQVIGSTNRLGEFAKDRPVHMQEIISTVYHNLGIDPRTTTLNDPTGRPQYLIEQREPLRELV